MDAPFPAGMVDEIRDFLANDYERERGLDLYPEVFDTHSFFPLQRMGELVQMMQIARSIKPKTVMEIGADKGGGFYHWIKCLSTVETAIACEIRGLPYAKWFERAFPTVRFRWVEGSSYADQCVHSVAKFLGGTSSIDCLFIDGDKGEFLRDFKSYLPLMSKNGIVFMHDIQDKPGPADAFAEVGKLGYRTEAIINKSDTFLAMKREKEELPCTNAHEGWLRYWRGMSCGVGVIRLNSEY